MTPGLQDLEAILARPTPPPLPGQLTISVATIGHHVFEGPGLWCQAEDFGQACGAHRDEHQHAGEDD